MLVSSGMLIGLAMASLSAALALWDSRAGNRVAAATEMSNRYSSGPPAESHRAGMVARIWADCDLIHVLIGGIRIKTVRSHLSVADLARLTAEGAVPAGPSPLPPVEDSDAVEVERCVSRGTLA